MLSTCSEVHVGTKTIVVANGVAVVTVVVLFVVSVGFPALQRPQKAGQFSRIKGTTAQRDSAPFVGHIPGVSTQGGVVVFTAPEVVVSSSIGAVVAAAVVAVVTSTVVVVAVAVDLMQAPHRFGHRLLKIGPTFAAEQTDSA